MSFLRLRFPFYSSHPCIVRFFAKSKKNNFTFNANAEAVLFKISSRYVDLKAKLDSLSLDMSEKNNIVEAANTAKELKTLEPLAEGMENYAKIKKSLKEMEELTDSNDKEMADLAFDEIKVLNRQFSECSESLLELLVPPTDSDARNAIIEVRAGTGGLEASLFAQELFQMYKKYSSTQGWRWEEMGMSTSDVGGLREGSALIKGTGVFGKLKFEAGAHRVQRIPKTETAGRVHTSTATVAILPEATAVDIKINDNDLKFDFFRSSGAGGQSVNKTESAVRITHLPSGIAVANQDERSQHLNKAKAMKILLSKLYSAEQEKIAAARSRDRNLQIGTGDRGDRIRTYNFAQGRITDHRIGYSKYDMEAMMDGQILDDFVDELTRAHHIDMLDEMYGIKIDTE